MYLEAGDIAQLYGSPVALAEDMTLVPSTHTVVHSYSNSSSRELDTLFLTPQTSRKFMVTIHTWRQNNIRHKIKIKKSEKASRKSKLEFACLVSAETHLFREKVLRQKPDGFQFRI